MKADLYISSLTNEFKHSLWAKFIKAITTYELIEENDKICVCISGGKDSMIMAKLFQLHQQISTIHYDLKYIVMNPGYNSINLEKIKQNLNLMNIDADIIETDIFQITSLYDEKPCFLCAKMRRGALYGIAQGLGCNKIALGHHYDDVIETTLMNILYAGSIQTMLPKLYSDNYEGLELIRPMYLIREADIIDYKNENKLEFIDCACRLTEGIKKDEIVSARKKVKELIANLSKEDDQIEKNIFSSINNVYIDKVISYKSNNKTISFLDNYKKK